MNQPLYKEPARSGFQIIKADEWENGRLFKWQERKINELAAERRIVYKKLRGLMMEWVGRDLIGGLNRKQGMIVIKQLKNFPKLVDLEVEKENRKMFEQRSVGVVKVREF